MQGRTLRVIHVPAAMTSGWRTINKCLTQILQTMKVTYIAKYEVGRRPHSHWETKEFPTQWEATKFLEESYKKGYTFCPGFVYENIEETPREIAEHEYAQRCFMEATSKSLFRCAH